MINDIKIGPITVHMYGMMMMVGFLVALWMSLRRGKKLGFNTERIWDIFYGAVIGGILGARLLFYIVEIPQIIQRPSLLWDFKNGYVIYGGIIGGIAAAMLICRKNKEEFLPYFDLIMPAVSLAQGFGRIGCFCAGCCYGRETTGWFAIEYWMSKYAPNGVRLLPTQLISTAGDWVICLLLVWYASKKHAKGQVGAMWMMVYGVGRFCIEFLRNDYRGSVGALSTSQTIAICMITLGAALWYIMGRRSKAAE